MAPYGKHAYVTHTPSKPQLAAKIGNEIKYSLPHNIKQVLFHRQLICIKHQDGGLGLHD